MMWVRFISDRLATEWHLIITPTVRPVEGVACFPGVIGVGPDGEIFAIGLVDDETWKLPKGKLPQGACASCREAIAQAGPDWVWLRKGTVGFNTHGDFYVRWLGRRPVPLGQSSEESLLANMARGPGWMPAAREWLRLRAEGWEPNPIVGLKHWDSKARWLVAHEAERARLRAAGEVPASL